MGVVCVDVVLTWCSCKHDGEEVNAHSDAIEDGKSSEAVGYRVSLWRSVRERSLKHVWVMCKTTYEYQRRTVTKHIY